MGKILKENIKKFVHETSAKGIPKIFKSEHSFSKLLWLIATGLCFIVAAILCYNLISSYLQYQTNTRWVAHYCQSNLQSPTKESIHFCQAEYSKLRGDRWKVGSEPNPPLSWSKLDQVSFWNSKKWLHTNKNSEKTFCSCVDLLEFQNEAWYVQFGPTQWWVWRTP